jgi:hypothetical protein
MMRRERERKVAERITPTLSKPREILHFVVIAALSMLVLLLLAPYREIFGENALSLLLTAMGGAAIQDTLHERAKPLLTLIVSLCVAWAIGVLSFYALSPLLHWQIFVISFATALMTTACQAPLLNQQWKMRLFSMQLLVPPFIIGALTILGHFPPLFNGVFLTYLPIYRVLGNVQRTENPHIFSKAAERISLLYTMLLGIIAVTYRIK